MWTLPDCYHYENEFITYEQGSLPAQSVHTHGSNDSLRGTCKVLCRPVECP